MAIKLITAPNDEPVSLVEARQHLRIPDEDTTQDSLIQACIIAARQYAEAKTRRALVVQQWQLSLDAFPRWSGLQYGAVIELPFPPLKTVDEFKYTDTAGVETVLGSGTDYILDSASEPARLVTPYGKFWPIARSDTPNAVQIKFTCGYGEPSEIPEGIKRWLLLRVGALFETREEAIGDRGVVVLSLPFVDGLLDPFRVMVL